MGFKHVEAALQAQLPHQDFIDMGTLKLVLVAICQHADNETDFCFPSTRRLARMTHLGKSTVAKAIGYLNGMGCFNFYAVGGGRGSSNFTINMTRLKDWAINWKSVHPVDANEDNEAESSVHHMDTQPEEENRSVHPVDVASTTETQRPPCKTQRPPADPNQSFDRLAVPSSVSVNADASRRTTPSNKEESQSHGEVPPKYRIGKHQICGVCDENPVVDRRHLGCCPGCFSELHTKAVSA